MRPPSTAAYSMLKRRITTLLGVAALTATVVVVPAAAATTDTGAGSRPDGFEAPQTLTAAAASESSMEMLVNERGRISKSVDATAGRLLEVDKPDGATVRGAYLGVATTGFKQFRLPAGSVTLAGQPVTLGNETASGIYSYNYFADVTDIVKPAIDGAPTGITTLPVAETYPGLTEGEVLVVVFDDPSVRVDKSVTVLYGALNPAGDTYGLQLARAVDASDPATQLEMALGISFGAQGYSQYSTVEVNGQPLTSAAGGQDDGGEDGNGSLITVGGIGDSTANPADPTAFPSGARSDDELYDLRPFVNTGDRSIRVTTTNPSNDDNVFLAVFEMNPPVIGVSVGIDPLPMTPDYQRHLLGETAMLTLAPIPGELDFFSNFTSQVVSGPNAGLDYTFTCASGCFVSTGATAFFFTAAADAEPGIDLIEVWDDKNNDAVRGADEPYGYAQVHWSPAVHAVGMGDSYSSGEGAGSYDDETDVPAITFFGDLVHNRCHRSEHAYARLSQPPLYTSSVTSYVGGVTDSRADFIACSGATTTNVKFGGEGQYDEQPQLEQGKLSARTNLVTLSLGGNDIGFSDIIKKCVLRKDCVNKKTIDGMPVPDWADAQLAALPGKLAPVLASIRTEAPNATVVLMGYPKVFPDENRWCPDLSAFFRNDAMDWANGLAERLDSVMASAAAEAGVHFVSVQDRFAGHEICGPEGSWIWPFISPGIPDMLNKQAYSPDSFHPTRDGQRYGYAAALNAFLNGGDAGDGLTDAAMPANPAPATRLFTTSAQELTTAMPSSLGTLHVAFDPTAAEAACLVDSATPGGVVPARGQMWVTGDGFRPGASVTVAADASGPEDPEARVALATVTADAQGRIGQVLEVPAAEHGSYLELTATGATAQGRQELLAVVLVVNCAQVGQGPQYTFDGFYAPVNNAPTVNTTKAGSAVPVKFSLGGAHGLDIFAAGSPSSTRVDCSSSAATDDIEQTVSPGSSTLAYSPDTGRYQYVWKTQDTWAGTCRRLDVTLTDGTTRSAFFAFR